MAVQSVQVKRFITHSFIQNTTAAFPVLSTTIFKTLSSQFFPDEIVFIKGIKRYGKIDKQKNERRNNVIVWYKVNLIGVDEKENNKNNKTQHFMFSDIERVEKITKNDIMNYLFTITDDTPFGKVLKANVIPDLDRLEKEFHKINFGKILCDKNKAEKIDIKNKENTNIPIKRVSNISIDHSMSTDKPKVKDNFFSKEKQMPKDGFSIIRNVKGQEKHKRHDNLPEQTKFTLKKVQLLPKPEPLPKIPEIEKREKTQYFGKKLAIPGLQKKEISIMYEVTAFICTFKSFLGIKSIDAISFMLDFIKKGYENELTSSLHIKILSLLNEENKNIGQDDFRALIADVTSKDNSTDDSSEEATWKPSSITKNNWRLVLSNFLNAYTPDQTTFKLTSYPGRMCILKHLIDCLINTSLFKICVDEIIEKIKRYEKAKAEIQSNIKKKNIEIKTINDDVRNIEIKIKITVEEMSKRKNLEKHNIKKVGESENKDIVENIIEKPAEIVNEKQNEEEIRKILEIYQKEISEKQKMLESIRIDVSPLEKEIYEIDKILLNNRYKTEIGRINGIPFHYFSSNIFYIDKEIYIVEDSMIENVIKTAKATLTTREGGNFINILRVHLLMKKEMDSSNEKRLN